MMLSARACAGSAAAGPAEYRKGASAASRPLRAQRVAAGPGHRPGPSRGLRPARPGRSALDCRGGQADPGVWWARAGTAERAHARTRDHPLGSGVRAATRGPPTSHAEPARRLCRPSAGRLRDGRPPHRRAAAGGRSASGGAGRTARLRPRGLQGPDGARSGSSGEDPVPPPARGGPRSMHWMDVYSSCERAPAGDPARSRAQRRTKRPVAAVVVAAHKTALRTWI